ncbi:uroporphyrinogen-III synthase [Albidovulum inexpectatum]|uniref:Uroporphyrinogen-III synthase n=1 Tax=Albidovulum inexpectatum TaxID=196587 RepID=A0A2S5JLS9_9RHOB|nr:uroporphyrinogen-III synthase [Albidovulum inexpectatum]PPB82439.1 uroporphyrinogen-III synthase [Albidovulum inexpectatum]
MGTFRPTLLLTRPRPQSVRFARDFRETFGRDWPVVISPLIEIVHLPATVPGDVGGVLFTSQHAVAALSGSRLPAGLPAWCVGPRTAAAARASGFDVQAGAPGDAAGLVRILQDVGVRGPLLYPRGRHVARDLEQALAPLGIPVLPAIVYNQRPLPATQEALDLVGGPDPVLLPLFSPRSARLAVREFAQARAPIHAVAISEAARQAGADLPVCQWALADSPDADGMMRAMARLIGAGNAA